LNYGDIARAIGYNIKRALIFDQFKMAIRHLSLFLFITLAFGPSGEKYQIIPVTLMVRERLIRMVKHIEFRTTLVNTELGEAYSWIELRNHVEQNLTTKRLFDDWDKDAVLRLISPYLKGTRKHETYSFLEALEVVFEEVRDNDTVIVVEDECVRKVVLALVEYLYQESYGVKPR
jgi:hypothetical protein